MELYHIHRSNSFDELYKEGNSFIVGEKVNGLRNNTLEESASMIYKSEVREDGMIIDHRKNIFDFLDEKKINNMTSEEKKDLLNNLKRYIWNSEIDIREFILEEVRKEIFPDRPSRYKCIWLCNKCDINSWKKLLKVKDNNYQIFKVETATKPFVSLERLLPALHFPRDIMYEQALQYWNPTKEDLRKRKKEYLYTGELKIKERIM